MNIKSAKNISYIILELILAGCIALIFYKIKSKFEIGDRNDVFVEMKAVVLKDEAFQLFYSENIGYSEEQSLKIPVKGNNDFQIIKMKMPVTDVNISYFRLDFGSKKEKIIIKEISLKTDGKEYIWKGGDIIRNFSYSAYLDKPILKNDNAVYSINGIDPYIYINKSISNEYAHLLTESKKNRKINAVILTISVFLFLFIYIRTWKATKIINYPTANHDKPPLNSKTSNVNKWMLTAFMLFILLPCINMHFKIIPEATNYEKRVLQSEPFFQSKSFERYTKEYTDYFNDHFGFRNLLIKLNSFYKVKLLHTSPKPSVVILGKKNWLFYSEKGDLCISAEPLWTSAELDDIEKTLVERTLRLKKNETDYYLLIAPDKPSIYPEYMPDEYRNRNLNARLDQLFNRLHKNKLLKIIDVRQTLRNAKTKREVYYSSDTHWNMYGALLAYDQLISTIKKDHPEITSQTADGYNYLYKEFNGGDLSQMLNLPEIYTKAEWIPAEKGHNDILIKPYYNYTVGNTLTYTNPLKKNNLKLVLIHDSFANYWLSSINRDFGTSIFRWSNAYENETVETARPDIVVHEMVSRFTQSLKIP